MDLCLRLLLSITPECHQEAQRSGIAPSPTTPALSAVFSPSLPPKPPFSPFSPPFVSDSYLRSAAPQESLANKERAPPARPLPLEFPNYVPSRNNPHPLSRRHMSNFRRTLIKARKPTDLNEEILDCLNACVEVGVSLSSPNFVPEHHFPTRPYLYDDDLTAMLQELSTENEDAFREVMRQPPLEGRQRPRVAYSRNFFGSMEDLARYWDSSKDRYYEVEVPVEEEKADTVSEKQDLPPIEVDKDGDTKMIEPDPSESTSHPQGGSTSNTVTPSIEEKSDKNSSAEVSNHEPKKKEVYKGPRLGNSSQVPPPTRINAVRNLLKMVIHKFNCRDYDISPRERLKIRDVNIPQGLILYSFAVCRMPKDRALARARHVEGPVMSVNVRHEVIFNEDTYKKLVDEEDRDRNEIGDFLGDKVDLLRELGGMLLVALQRQREGKGSKDEAWKKETENWWWANEKRWGGGEVKWGNLACEVYEDEDPSWSPEEKRLQTEKKQKAEDGMKQMEELANKEPGQGSGDGNGNDNGNGNGSVLEVDAEKLMADTGGAKSAAAALSSSMKNDNDPAADGGRPPKKKGRFNVAERPRPTTDASKEAVGAREGRERKRERDKEEKAEVRDGRRVMYLPPMKKKWYREWTNVRPNASMWDDKIIYRRVGMPRRRVEDGHAVPAEENVDGGGHDEVYQVSCVNHHVALMKMRVSTRYLEWLERGELAAAAKNGAGHSRRDEAMLKAWRSRWFDLFDVQQRQEFLAGLWRVMSWVCREDVPQAEWEKVEALRREREGGGGGGMQQ